MPPTLGVMYRVLTPADRARAWAFTAATTGLLGWLIVTGLAMAPERAVQRSLDLFTVAPPPPPPERVVPERVPSRKPAGEAAPSNLRATPKEVVAPEPVVPPPVPLPPAPPVAATGPDVSSGATDRPGPGTGAGGIGNGRGAGGSGDGTGSGYGPDTYPRLIRDRISMKNFPEELEGISMRLDLRYTVTVDGRVTNCRVVRSSGYPAVDAMICPEAERGFRYRPWRDPDGRAVPSTVLREMELNVEP